MKKLLIILSLLATMICVTGCNNESENLESRIGSEMESYECLKTDIMALNADYAANVSPETRLRPWLRWLIFGAADTAGAIFGGVAGACSASALAWTVTKSESVSANESQSTPPAAAIKGNNLANLTFGSPGYIHNSVISAFFVNNKFIYEESAEKILDSLFTELYVQTGVELENKNKAKVIIEVNKIIKCFNVNKDIDVFFADLIAQTKDSNQKKH